jgi:GT2 family glycosyltransferase
MTDVPFDHLREVEYVIGACQLFRKDAQVAAGWIDPKIFYGPDDADWCLRIRRAGFKVALEPRAKVVHEYRRRSAAHPLSRLALRHLRDFTYFQRKWHPMRRWRLEEAARIDGTDGRLSATPSSPDDRADGPGRERGEPDGADGSIR